MKNQLRWFLFFIQMMSVLSVAALLTVFVLLALLGFLFVYNPTHPISEIEISEVWSIFILSLDAGWDYLEKHSVWNSIAFLIIQSCALFLILHLAKFLDGRRKVTERTKEIVQLDLTAANDALLNLSLGFADIASRYEITDSKPRVAELTYAEGQETIRDLMRNASNRVGSLRSACEIQKEYLALLDIENKLSAISDQCEIILEAIANASSKQIVARMIAEFGKCRAAIGALSEAKLGIE